MNGIGGEILPKQDSGSASVVDRSTPSLQPPQTQRADLVTRILQFLSTASAATIGAILVGLAACTYLILGRIGLVLIGAFLGISLHAAWENSSSSEDTRQYARRENGIEVARRVLEWRERKTVDGAQSDDNEMGVSSFAGFQPQTAAALNELVDAVIRDYVKWWYSPILPEERAFPSASRQVLTKFVVAVSSHLSRKRPADIFLDFLTNSTSIVIVFLSEIASAMQSSAGAVANVSAAEVISMYLASNTESNLANVLNENQQKRKFTMVSEDILQNFLETSTYECDPARVFLREVLAGVVLEITLKSCSKADFINQWIVWSLEDGEPVINNAFEMGMSNSNGSGLPFADIDGNVGNLPLAKPPPRSPAEKERREEGKRHKKRLSKAEEAMEEAMEEAQRLSRLIAEEDAKKTQNSETYYEGGFGLTDLSKQSDIPSLVAAEDFRPPTAPYKVQGDVLTPRIIDTRETSRSPKSTQISPSSDQAGSVPFTSFDQILPATVPAALQDGSSRPSRKTVSLTLHNAIIVILDDSSATDRGKLRSKPSGEYLLQIEPPSSDHPGWMIMRKYSDFETLHEVLRRIAQISGVTAFTEQHRTLPHWKEHTKASLRGELERYLRDACWYQPLAESEGMKRFLEKDQGQSFSPGAKPSFPSIGWPTPSTFETMGKGVLDVLAGAPKGAAEGGKAVGGAITGVFTNIGNLNQKRTSSSSASSGMHTAARSSTSVLPRMDSLSSINGASSQAQKSRASEDSLLATSPLVYTQPSPTPPMERRPSHASIGDVDNERESRYSISARSSMSGRRSATQSRDPSRAPSRRGTPLSSLTQGLLNGLQLPPPPSDIPDDYGSQQPDEPTRISTSTAPSQSSPGHPSLSGSRQPSTIPLSQYSPQKHTKTSTPLTEPETRMAVELLFAVITELYTLSSAWNIRRTLLNAAKTFLLRPGNPSLSSIQTLIQDSIIAANTSDEGVATHLRKLRENALPTEEELEAWPEELTGGEKEALRVKARNLLVERGVPAALTGVMGQAATSECLGKIFDCLQEERVSRGLVFGLLLQCVRAVAH